MPTPRSKLVDPVNPLHYHLISRCVRRSWLCGTDKHTGKSYNHRKKWLKKRLFQLAQCFAIEVDAFAIMSNHFHLVVLYDPCAAQSWSDREVVRRWLMAFPPKQKDSTADEFEARKQLLTETLLDNTERISQLRETLGSLSMFMKHLKQPLALMANQEDRCTGHFFEGRFYSGALLCEDGVLAAMAYVDLNPVRAKIAKSIEACQDSSISMRMKAIASTPEKLKDALQPLVSGLETASRKVGINLGDYITRVQGMVKKPGTATLTNKETRWINQMASIRKRQPAYGMAEDLEAWVVRQGLIRPGQPLPE